jgi:protein translocase SecG subunit
VLIILIQKGSSSMGLGNFGGSNLALFGGSGGQNIFQKITWVLGFIFIAGSLVLSIMKTNMVKSSRYMGKYAISRPVQQAPAAPEQPQ